ncbi:hypothetical protein ASPZODRAFT_12389 [Penicilliopsis zonata CBS 506.65]|uniref:DUF6594 domain-containing protein n=1 Tax=Penicilliopsis zonata CBS 506.65 TaxID=1073090 RepID=A0A1L9SWI8_9EURO|nr:hypothetical protein ASPZODRAFT_12389 [Penicilliopsis zonata CBS 506.65]OJJ51572.1 hypothetical protein ASPZODRAFT_12389 [Penicilliopsis zonata CBS 506.65]
MPLRSGVSHSKKGSRKEVVRRASTSSSSTLLSTASAPKSTTAMTTASAPKDRLSGSLPATKAPAAKTKLIMTSKKTPSVFEFLEKNGKTDNNGFMSQDDMSSSGSESDAESQLTAPSTTMSTRPSPPVYQQPKDAGKPIQTSPLVSKQAQAPVARSRPSMTVDTSKVITGMQFVNKVAGDRRISMAGSFTPTPSPTETSNPMEKKSYEISTSEKFYTSSEDASDTHRPPLPPSPPKSPEGRPRRSHHRSRRHSKTMQVSSGYGFLSSHLVSSTAKNSNTQLQIPPLYRKFEALNHRVLLHLQDEIAEMEEDIQTLDEYDEMHRVATAQQEGTKPLPASRRMDEAQVYSSLHNRRVELMNTLIHKTEQYNNALSAFSKVLQTLPPASEEDITTYRTWMEKTNPVALVETRFLNHDEDLVSLTGSAARLDLVRSQLTTPPIYATIIAASTAILLPLLAFSMIHEFFGRLVVVTVICGSVSAIAATYAPGGDQLVESRDGWLCAALYFSFMTLAAMFIP